MKEEKEPRQEHKRIPKEQVALQLCMKSLRTLAGVQNFSAAREASRCLKDVEQILSNTQAGDTLYQLRETELSKESRPQQ